MQYAGIAQLDPELTLNGITELPALRYKLGDADATDLAPWGYGSTLPVVSGGGLSFNAGAPGLGADDDSCLFDGTGYYADSAATVGNIGTDDFVLEMVLSPLANTRVYGKTAAGPTGWRVYATGSQIVAGIADGAEVLVGTAASASPLSTYVHCMFFMDRSGSGQAYVNGVVSGAAVAISGSAGDADTATGLRVGNADSTPFSGNLVYVAMWNRAAWLDTHLQASTAKERFLRMCGVWPQIARGTAAPNTAQRATSAMLDKVEGSARKLYLVGSGWLRCCSRDDSASTNVRGYLAEPAATNLHGQSAAAASWTQIYALTVNADVSSPAAPDRSATADGLAHSAVSQGEFIRHQVASSIGQSYAYSVWLQKGAHDWAMLRWVSSSSELTYFDLNTGAVGTTGATTVASIEDWGNGWYRCIVVFAAGATSLSCYVYPAEADGDIVFTGDGSTNDVYVWGAQIEAGARSSSHIPTAGVAATRNKDELQYVGDDGNLGGVGSNLRGRASSRILLPSYDVAAELSLLTLSDGGAATDLIEATVGTDDALDAISAATAGNAGAAGVAGDVADGALHDVTIGWRTDRLRITRDGVAGTDDTSVDPPDNLDRIDVGQDVAGAQQPGALISNLQIERAD
jgi:hypothetical protein